MVVQQFIIYKYIIVFLYYIVIIFHFLKYCNKYIIDITQNSEIINKASQYLKYRYIDVSLSYFS